MQGSEGSHHEQLGNGGHEKMVRIMIFIVTTKRVAYVIFHYDLINRMNMSKAHSQHDPKVAGMMKP